MFLLDTMALSELIRIRPDPAVHRWYDSTPEALLFTSVVAIGEVIKGLTRQPNDRRSAWLNTTLALLEGRVLPVTLEVAQTWGGLVGRATLRGEPLPVADSLIAATAIVHNLTVVTRNTRDFERCGARVLNPWTGSP